MSINGNNTLTAGNVGVPYTNTLTASGGTGALTWSLEAARTCRRGSFYVGRRAHGHADRERAEQLHRQRRRRAGHTASRKFTLQIYPNGVPAPVFQTQAANFGTWSIGQIETQLTATDGDGSNYAWSVVAGSLPPGISIRTDKPNCCFANNASAGLIGVATTPGTYIRSRCG